MTKKQRKTFDHAYDQAFRRMAGGIQFNILDLNPMRNQVADRVLDGVDLDTAMTEAIEQFRQN